MKPIRPVIREVESPIHQSNVSGPARRQSAKQWRISDRLLAVFLLFVAVASLVADVMVIYIYLTNDAQLIPTLADNPWHAYLWATVPLIMVTAIAMLPYFGSARKKVQFRLVYSALAIILFVFAWLPGFIGLFGASLTDTTALADTLFKGASGGAPDSGVILLKYFFMAGQILCLVFASSSSILAILIMVEERRVHPLLYFNPKFRYLRMVESALLKELSMTKDKLAGYEGLQKHIEREAQVFADEAVGRWKVLNARSK